MFVSAVYKVSQVCQESVESLATGNLIEAISTQLYEHYCSFTGVVMLDKHITNLIARCLDVLGLQQFSVNDSVSSRVNPKHSNNGSSPPFLGNVKHSQVLGEVSAQVQSFVPSSSSDVHSKSSTKEFRHVASEDSGSNNVETPGNTSTVNRLDVTQDLQETQNHLESYSVDRVAVTRSVQETVDSNSVTQSLQQEPVALPSERHVWPQGTGDVLGCSSVERSKTVHGKWKIMF